MELPVIDIFAGPGGLSEGFSRYAERDWEPVLSKPATDRGGHSDRPDVSFRVALSIEKDEFAHRTLQLRALARLMQSQGFGNKYVASLAQRGGPEGLFESDDPSISRLVEKAKKEAWRATLGDKGDDAHLDDRINAALGRSNSWVLIGGPPCQAYSLVGRARNKGISSYVPENDHRHFLYLQYLGIVARHSPPVFVMENVKGLLSSQVGGARMFEKITADLRSPSAAMGKRRRGAATYELLPIAVPESDSLFGDFRPEQYLVKMERHGIPQARHRVILLGIRNDVTKKPELLKGRASGTVGGVLGGLMPVRSGINDFEDSFENWAESLREAARAPWVARYPEIRSRIKEVVESLRPSPVGRGSDLLPKHYPSRYAVDWFGRDLPATLNHVTRTHRSDDLHRYLFAACYADAHGVSPTLAQFPGELLPNHRSAKMAVRGGGYFGDRFRVQVRGKPSTTITSHISKDGHYYIHYDPMQCRSLTVREAARLQTFPDDYFFCGPRTEQYHQVGNAVPPLLAVQIARIVAGLLN